MILSSQSECVIGTENQYKPSTLDKPGTVSLLEAGILINLMIHVKL